MAREGNDKEAEGGTAWYADKKTLRKLLFSCHLQLGIANIENKPDRATMRPDCVPTWSEIRAACVRRMDEQTEQMGKLLEYLT